MSRAALVGPRPGVTLGWHSNRGRRLHERLSAVQGRVRACPLTFRFRVEAVLAAAACCRQACTCLAGRSERAVGAVWGCVFRQSCGFGAVLLGLSIVLDTQKGGAVLNIWTACTIAGPGKSLKNTLKQLCLA